jgi:hypothetical protein
MNVRPITRPLVQSGDLDNANRALRAYLQETAPMKSDPTTRSMKTMRDRTRTKQAKSATIARKRARQAKRSYPRV